MTSNVGSRFIQEAAGISLDTGYIGALDHDASSGRAQNRDFNDRASQFQDMTLERFFSVPFSWAKWAL